MKICKQGSTDQETDESHVTNEMYRKREIKTNQLTLLYFFFLFSRLVRVWRYTILSRTSRRQNITIMRQFLTVALEKACRPTAEDLTKPLGCKRRTMLLEILLPREAAKMVLRQDGVLSCCFSR